MTALPRAHALTWLGALRLYLAVTAAGNLAWEAAHVTLYTLWREGSWREIAYAVVHCSGGDVVIAGAALVAGLVLFGQDRWPHARFGAVAAVTVATGVAVTIVIERLSVEVYRRWSYAEAMPVISVLGFDLGLSPVLQWLVVPTIGLVIVRTGAR